MHHQFSANFPRYSHGAKISLRQETLISLTDHVSAVLKSNSSKKFTKMTRQKVTECHRKCQMSQFDRVRMISYYCSILTIIIIIIIIKNECHSNTIVDRLQGCSHSKKLQESESESRSSKVV